MSNITQINAVMIFLVIHYIADFLMQHPWIANNKSKRSLPLLAHVFIHGALIGTGSFFLYGYSASLTAFILINTVSHGVVDYNTSRISSRLFKEEKYYKFFNILGIDQLTHQLVMIYSLNLFY